MLRNWSIHWPAAAFVTGAIVGSTLLTGELQIPCPYKCTTQFVFGKDKIFHAAAFAALGFTLSWALSRNPTRSTKRIILEASAYGLALGAVTEVLQPFAGRTCDLFDFFADCTGLIVGYGAFQVCRRGLRLMRRNHSPTDNR